MDTEEDVQIQECATSDTEDEENKFNINKIQESLIYKVTEARKELKKLPKVSRSKLKNALRILNREPDTEEDVQIQECVTSNTEDEENEFDINKIQESLIYKVTEARKELEKLPKVSRSKLKNALRILKREPTAKYKKTLPIETKRYLKLQKFCTNKASVSLPQEIKTAWFSPKYIMELIRTCILTRNWNYVTYLLLMLLKHNKRYWYYIRQTTLLMFMSNPNDYNKEFLNELLQLCKIKTS